MCQQDRSILNHEKGIFIAKSNFAVRPRQFEMNELDPRVFVPSFEEGALRPLNKKSRYLKRAQRGRSDVFLQEFDLPGRAESKVALLA